jgi:hypothetical protein
MCLAHFDIDAAAASGRVRGRNACVWSAGSKVRTCSRASVHRMRVKLEKVMVVALSNAALAARR